MNTLKKLTYLALSGLVLGINSCEKQPASSTTYITNNEPSKDSEAAKTEVPEKLSELAAVEGKRSSGKLYLRYTLNTSEVKKWTILAPFEIKLHQNYNT